MPWKSNNIWVVSHKYHLIQVYTFFYHSFAVKKYLEKWYSKTYLSVFFHSKRFPQKSFPKMRRMHMILIFLKSPTNLQPPTYSINFHTSSEKNFTVSLLWKSTFFKRLWTSLHFLWKCYKTIRKISNGCKEVQKSLKKSWFSNCRKIFSRGCMNILWLARRVQISRVFQKFQYHMHGTNG